LDGEVFEGVGAEREAEGAGFGGRDALDFKVNSVGLKGVKTAEEFVTASSMFVEVGEEDEEGMPDKMEVG
jgi:hypothetical protein